NVAMNYTETSPCAALARIVECYWFLTGDGSVREPRRVVPDGRTEIILNFAAPFAQQTATGWRRQPRHFFAGQITGPLMLRPTGPFAITGTRLRPAGARALFSRPQSELTDQIIPLRRLNPALLRLNHTNLDGALSALTSPPDPQVEAAANLLIETA